MTRDSRPYRVLKSLTPDTSWKQIEEQPRLDLPDAPEAVVSRLVDALIRRGRGPVYGFDLSDPREASVLCAHHCPAPGIPEALVLTGPPGPDGAGK